MCCKILIDKARATSSRQQGGNKNMYIMKVELNNREFRLWKYSISHSMLLIRSNKSNIIPTNIDLYFSGVKIIKFHQYFKINSVTSFIKNVDEDILAECLSYNISFEEKEIFVFRGNNQKCYIVASCFNMEENNKDIFSVNF